MEIVNDFFNKTAQAIDKKYFPDVKYYMDDKNCAKVHRTLELFNNGVLGYEKLIERLAKACNDTKKTLHNIVKEFIADFQGYEYKTYSTMKKLTGSLTEIGDGVADLSEGDAIALFVSKNAIAKAKQVLKDSPEFESVTLRLKKDNNIAFFDEFNEEVDFHTSSASLTIKLHCEKYSATLEAWPAKIMDDNYVRADIDKI